MKVKRTHAESVASMGGDWGQFTEITPDYIVKQFEARLEKWFDQWWEGLTSDYDLSKINRWDVGYAAVDFVAADASVNLNQYGFGDTEGGMAVCQYVRHRIGLGESE